MNRRSMMRTDGRWLLLTLILLPTCAGPDAAPEAAAVAPADSPAAAAPTPASTPGPAAPGPAVVPAPAPPAATAAPGYQLSLADLEKWVTATGNIRRAAQADPGLAAVLQAIPEPRTLQQLEAAYAGLRPAREAIEAAGLSVRDFATIGFAYAQAAVAAGAVQSGARRDSIAGATGVSARNIDFVLQNEAAIARLLQPLEPGGR
jgi:hypothetical protein